MKLTIRYTVALDFKPNSFVESFFMDQALALLNPISNVFHVEQRFFDDVICSKINVEFNDVKHLESVLKTFVMANNAMLKTLNKFEVSYLEIKNSNLLDETDKFNSYYDLMNKHDIILDIDCDDTINVSKGLKECRDFIQSNFDYIKTVSGV